MPKIQRAEQTVRADRPELTQGFTPQDYEKYIDGLVDRLNGAKANVVSQKSSIIAEIAKAAVKIKSADSILQSDKLNNATEEIKDKIQRWEKHLPAGLEEQIINIPQTCYTQDIINAADTLGCGLVTKLTLRNGTLKMTGIKSTNSWTNNMYSCGFLLSLPGILYGMEKIKKAAEEFQKPAGLIILSLEAVVAGLTTFKSV